MLKLLDFVENVVMLVAFTAALALGVYQVVLRYVFNSGFQWMEGTIILLTLWAVLVGGSRAVRDRLHARVGIVADALPPRPRQVVNLVVVALALAYIGAMLVFGYRYVDFLHGVGSRSLRVQIPTWQVFVIVPSFLGMYFVRYAVEFWKLARDPNATLSSGVSEELSDEFLEEQLDVLESERANASSHGGDR
jgi:TRAP-type C4-dicarboxylate transport system permease small subunit